MNIELILFGASLLLLISIFASKISDRFGVPALLLFLILGMLAGSDGPGGIYFDDPSLAQSIGIFSLILILFSGGLDTKWDKIRLVFKEGLILSTLGVLITAVVVGFFVHLLLGLSIEASLLLGAIVSSTDAAAVFSVLRSKGINLKGKIAPLLELESGSNDPMAIFLTIGLIQLIKQPDISPLSLVGSFFIQMIIGTIMGYVMSWIILFLINKSKLGYDGLYPVMTLAMVFLIYTATNTLGGNGFLSVYLVGIFLSRHNFIHKRSLVSFHDGIAWLMQIAMFLTLGLLVFPSRLMSILIPGLLIAICLMFFARPVSVFLAMIPGGFNWREKLFISWVGLRGAVPIILATYPLLAGIPQSEMIFNVVFFVVLTSVLMQGTTISKFAQWLKVDEPIIPKRIYPLEYTPVDGLKSDLVRLFVDHDSEVIGKAVVDLTLPDSFLIILIARGDDYFISKGSSVLEAGDTLLVLSDKKALNEVQRVYGLKEKGE